MPVKQGVEPDRALATEIERIAAIVRQTPVEHPSKLDRWPYAAAPRSRRHSLADDIAVVALILLLFVAVGLLGGL